MVKQKIDEFGIVTLVTGPRACGDGDQVDPVARQVDALREEAANASLWWNFERAFDLGGQATKSVWGMSWR